MALTARRSVLLGLLAASLLFQLVTLYSPAVPGTLPFPHADKVVHAGIFAAPVGLALLAGVDRRLVLGLAAVHAPVSELIQALVLRDRAGDLVDVLADLVGVALGALVAAVVTRRW